MKDPKIVSEEPAQWQILAEIELEPDADHDGRVNEAVEAVISAVRSLNLPKAHLERMQTAVRRTCLRAMEIGASQETTRPVVLRALASQSLDPSQGWGFFLIERRADGQAAGEGLPGNEDDESSCKGPCVIVELYLYREGDQLEQKREASTDR